MILPFGLMNKLHDLMVVQFAAAQRCPSSITSHWQTADAVGMIE